MVFSFVFYKNQNFIFLHNNRDGFLVIFTNKDLQNIHTHLRGSACSDLKIEYIINGITEKITIVNRAEISLTQKKRPKGTCAAVTGAVIINIKPKEEALKCMIEGFVRTDLAMEKGDKKGNGIKIREFTENGFGIHEMEVSENNSPGITPGHYVTIHVGQAWLLDKISLDGAVKTISGYIRKMASALGAGKSGPVLTVCLGNRKITSDAIGPLCADRLIVTRHLRTERRELFDSLGGTSVAVITPGVTGETGIESYESIMAAVRTVKPSYVICVDALAAKNVDRLTTAVQLSDAGISPGSGVGNSRKEISFATLGVPVISVGVPTVVQSSTLVCDALEKAGISEIPEALSQLLKNETDFFVTPKETDIAVSALAGLVAKAINTSLLGFAEL